MKEEFNNPMFDDLLEDNQNIEQPQDQEEGGTTLQYPINDDEQNGIEDGNNDGEENEDSDPVLEFLKLKGIEDPSKIKFETDEGNYEDMNFYDLSAEEQLNILSELSDPGLSNHEVEVVNYIRQSGLEFDQIIGYFQQKAINDYLAENPDKVRQVSYEVDDYSDDELYLADLKSKYNSWSEDELLSRLEVAKTNEDLFKKEVDALRDTYKQDEERRIEAEKEKRNQDYQELQNNIVEVLQGYDEISLDYNDPKSESLVIEDNEKQQILQYLVDRDKDGVSQFEKDLKDPQILVDLAWFALHGPEVLSGVSNYWKEVLKEERKEKLKLEKEIEKLKGTKTTEQPLRKSVVQQSTSQPTKGYSFLEKLL